MKTCRSCGDVKPIESFHIAAGNKDGRSNQCPDCKKAARRARHAASPEKYRAKRREAFIKNREAELASNAEWKRRTGKQYPPSKEVAARAGERWRKRNLHKMRLKTQQRRARKLRATPPWADHGQIAAVYERARLLELMTGKPHHVDHIQPLNGETSCGLNVGYNLRAIPAKYNLRKGNRTLRNPRGAQDRAFFYYCMVIEQAVRDGVWNLDKKICRYLSNG